MTGTITKAALWAGGEAAEAIGQVGARVLGTGLDLAKEAFDVAQGLSGAQSNMEEKVAGIAADAAGDAFKTVVDSGGAVGEALCGVMDAAGGLVGDVTDNPISDSFADKLSDWTSGFGW